MATLLFSLEELAHREGLAVAPAPAAWSLRFRLKFQLGNRERSAEVAGSSPPARRLQPQCRSRRLRYFRRTVIAWCAAHRA